MTGAEIEPPNESMKTVMHTLHKVVHGIQELHASQPNTNVRLLNQAAIQIASTGTVKLQYDFSLHFANCCGSSSV